LSFPAFEPNVSQLQMWERHMGLLVTYLVCLILGQALTIAVGLSIDRYYSPCASPSRKRRRRLRRQPRKALLLAFLDQRLLDALSGCFGTTNQDA
jgi:hypothetical protein